MRRSRRFIQRENLHRLFIVIAVITLVSTVSITLLEPKISLINGFWWTIVTMTTVGYGDISPTSLGGRVIAIMVMFFGIGILGMFSATIASVLVQNKLREERGLSKVQYQQHVILCEWNFRTAAVLRELRNDVLLADKPIVLIAELDAKPVEDDMLTFIAGNITDETLTRANIIGAKTVIILGSDKLDPTARDAKVVLGALTVGSMNPDAYTIVELASDTNVRHCERASVDEIIVNSDVTSGLLARAALDHGITKIISQWLANDVGDELYKIPVPLELIDKPFIDALVPMKQRHRCILLGIERAADGELISHVPDEYHLAANDKLIVVAPQRPQVDAIRTEQVTI